MQVVFLHADSGSASQTFVGPATLSKGRILCIYNNVKSLVLSSTFLKVPKGLFLILDTT